MNIYILADIAGEIYGAYDSLEKSENAMKELFPNGEIEFPDNLSVGQSEPVYVKGALYSEKTTDDKTIERSTNLIFYITNTELL